MIAYNLTAYDLLKPKRSYVRIFVISFLVLLNVYFFYFFLFGERGLVHYYQLKNQNNMLSNDLFVIEENDRNFYTIPKVKEGIENLDNKNCFLWFDDTKFCVFK
jgi:cell division protein FtsB